MRLSKEQAKQLRASLDRQCRQLDKRMTQGKWRIQVQSRLNNPWDSLWVAAHYWCGAISSIDKRVLRKVTLFEDLRLK